MTKEQILMFFEHVTNREDRYTVKDAFQFHQYHDGKQLVISEYEGQGNGDHGGASKSRRGRGLDTGVAITSQGRSKAP